MASRKQNATASEINYKRAQATFNRLNLEYQNDPHDDDRALDAYRKAKTELAAARSVWRAWRTEITIMEGDAIAKPPTIAATATIKKGN